MVTKLVSEGSCAAFGRKIASGIALAFAVLMSWMSASSTANAQFSSTSFSSSSSSLSSSSSRLELYDVNSTNNAVRSAVGSEIYTARDWVRSIIAQRRLRYDPRTGRPVPAFAPEAEGGTYGPFDALGYAKSGMVTKAPPMAAPAASSWYVASWGQGSADQEHRDITFGGVGIPSRTTSYTGLGGIDVVKIGILKNSDALVVGVLGSETSTNTRSQVLNTSRSFTPGAGMYASYIDGGFSTDFSFLANFTTTDGVEGGAAFNNRATDSYVFTGNVQYKYDIPNGNWWVEPTVGISYTHMIQNIGGATLTDGNQTRFQGGARAGTEWMWGSTKVQPTLLAVAYNDVAIDTPHLVGVAFVGPTDEHYLWGKGTGKLNFQWTDKFSTFVEGEVRGRSDVIGYAGRIAARVTY